jgi:hypothetical protein
MSRSPNFFIVGAPKSGTTAMDAYLERHPDIFMAEKEPHYFARDLLDQGDALLDKERYMRRFEPASDQKVIGESSVFYLYSKVAASLIHESDPNAKILIHLRDPVDFVASHHSQLVFVGGEPIKDLREALDAEPARRIGENLPREFRWYRTLLYTDIARFSDQVARFIDTFGRDRILINLYDDFRQDTAAVYRRTLEFLEVDSAFEPTFEVVNANKRMRSKLLMDVAVRNPPNWLSAVSRIVSPDTRRAIKNRIDRFNTKYEPREPMPKDVRQRLCDALRPDVERLGVLIDRDLGHWCRSN